MKATEKSGPVALMLGYCLWAASGLWAQSGPTHADSGWVPIFNGTNFPATDFYVYQSGYLEMNQQSKFSVQNGMIHAGGSYALLVTKKEYGYYKVAVEYMFGAAVGGNGNAGLMILMDNVGAKTIVSSTRPRSIEVNCRRDANYPWSLWAARDYGPYITSTIKPGTPDQYVAGGTPFTFDITADDNRVVRSSYPMLENPPGQWNHGEAWVYGDSGAFYLNGSLRTAGWKWVIPQGNTRVKVASGGIGVQTEGHDIWYRNWEVMELDPATLAPVNARRGCTDKTKPNYDPRAVVDNGSCTGTAILRIQRLRGHGAGSRRVDFQGRKVSPSRVKTGSNPSPILSIP